MKKTMRVVAIMSAMMMLVTVFTMLAVPSEALSHKTQILPEWEGGPLWSSEDIIGDGTNSYTKLTCGIDAREITTTLDLGDNNKLTRFVAYLSDGDANTFGTYIWKIIPPSGSGEVERGYKLIYGEPTDSLRTLYYIQDGIETLVHDDIDSSEVSINLDGDFSVDTTQLRIIILGGASAWTHDKTFPTPESYDGWTGYIYTQFGSAKPEHNIDIITEVESTPVLRVNTESATVGADDITEIPMLIDYYGDFTPGGEIDFEAEYLRVGDTTSLFNIAENERASTTITTSRNVAQTFTLDETTRMKRIEVFSQNGWVSDDTFAILSLKEGTPDGPGEVIHQEVQELAYGWRWIQVDFDLPIEIVGGQAYSFIVGNDGNPNNEKAFTIYSRTGNAYVDGDQYEYVSGTWSVVPVRDLEMKFSDVDYETFYIDKFHTTSTFLDLSLSDYFWSGEGPFEFDIDVVSRGLNDNDFIEVTIYLYDSTGREIDRMIIGDNEPDTSGFVFEERTIDNGTGDDDNITVIPTHFVVIPFIIVVIGFLVTIGYIIKRSNGEKKEEKKKLDR